jgi:hypothetical protein
MRIKPNAGLPLDHVAGAKMPVSARTTASDPSTMQTIHSASGGAEFNDYFDFAAFSDGNTACY